MTPDEIRMAWIKTVLDTHPAEVLRYRAGETKLLNFFLGETIRLSGGRANPIRTKAQLEQVLRA